MPIFLLLMIGYITHSMVNDIDFIKRKKNAQTDLRGSKKGRIMSLVSGETKILNKDFTFIEINSQNKGFQMCTNKFTK